MDKDSGKSKGLSLKKRKLDMIDGDEHFDVGETSVGPINEMYLAIKAVSLFPHGVAWDQKALVTDTQINKLS